MPYPFFDALKNFAGEVSSKIKSLAAGRPEDQLRSPLEVFLKEAGDIFREKIVAKGESRLPDRLGRPDYAVLVNKLLAGYIELKEPGKGADPKKFKGHDRKQWHRFKSLPNLLYCDGNEWGLYREGKLERNIVKLSGYPH